MTTVTLRPPTVTVDPLGIRVASVLPPPSTRTVTASASIDSIRNPRPRTPSRVPDGSPETRIVHTSSRQDTELDTLPDLAVLVDVLVLVPTETVLPLLPLLPQPPTATSRPATSAPVRSSVPPLIDAPSMPGVSRPRPDW